MLDISLYLLWIFDDEHDSCFDSLIFLFVSRCQKLFVIFFNMDNILFNVITEITFVNFNILF